MKTSVHRFVLWIKLDKRKTLTGRTCNTEKPGTRTSETTFYLKTRLSQQRNEGTSPALRQDKLIICQSHQLNEQSRQQPRDPLIAHQEHAAKRPHQTGLSELTVHLLTFTTPVVAAAANRQVHVQAPGGSPTLDDMLIPQLPVADQRHGGHTWPKQRSGGSSCEEVGLLWTLHVDQSH